MDDLNEIENLLQGLETTLEEDYKKISKENKPYEQIDELLVSLSKNQPHVPTKSSTQIAKETFGALPPSSYQSSRNTQVTEKRPLNMQTQNPQNTSSKPSYIREAIPLNARNQNQQNFPAVTEAVPLNKRGNDSGPQRMISGEWTSQKTPQKASPQSINGITYVQPLNSKQNLNQGTFGARKETEKTDVHYKNPLPNANVPNSSITYASNRNNNVVKPVQPRSTFMNSNYSSSKPVFDTQKIVVQILQGAEITVTNPLLHCVCSIPNTEFQFRTRNLTTIPSNWNERFNFIPVPIGEKSYSILRFEVFHNLNELVGNIEISLATLQMGKPYKVWLKLKNTKSGTGKVLVHIQTTKILCREPSLSTQVLNELITQCKQSGTKFCDTEFPCTSESLYKSPENHQNEFEISWKRPNEIAEKPELYVEGIESGDVIQGDLGDCYFLGAVSVIATRNDLLEPLFVSANPEYGIYQVKFYKNGRWQLITFDDRIPIRKDKRPIYARCKDRNEMWVPLIEKAYAKLHGCYEALEGGNLGAALTDLTGEFTQIYNFDEIELANLIKNGKLWEEMKWFQSEDYLMGCSHQNPAIQEVDNGMGLLYNHAYGILNLKDPKDALPEPLICLRNPWGHLEWTGRWSDNAKEWTDQIMKQLNFSFEDDGTFWMCLEDFFKQYNNLIVLRLLQDQFGKVWQKHVFESKWNVKTAGGCMNYQSWNQNPQYYIQATVPNTKIFVCLSQPDVRLDWKNDFSVDIGLYLLSHNNSKTKKKTIQPNELIKRTHFITSREISFDATISTDTDYVLIPATYEPKQELNYWLTIFSEEPINIFEIQTPEEYIVSLNGEWNFGNSGGCVNFPTWTKNPKYIVTPTGILNEKCLVSFVLKQRSTKTVYIGMYLGKFTGTIDRYSINKMVNCINAPQVSVDLELNSSDFPLFVMPNTFDPGEENHFEIICTSNVPLDMRSG